MFNVLRGYVYIVYVYVYIVYIVYIVYGHCDKPYKRHTEIRRKRHTVHHNATNVIPDKRHNATNIITNKLHKAIIVINDKWHNATNVINVIKRHNFYFC